MKKIMLFLVLFAALGTATMAQNKKAADSAAKAGKTTGVTKAGAPDMRFKANKNAKAKQDTLATQPAGKAPAQPAAATKGSTQTQPATSTANTTNDKIVGKDAKGRTLYLGPKGGQYIINSNGNKEWIKKG